MRKNKVILLFAAILVAVIFLCNMYFQSEMVRLLMSNRDTPNGHLNKAGKEANGQLMKQLTGSEEKEDVDRKPISQYSNHNTDKEDLHKSSDCIDGKTYKFNLLNEDHSIQSFEWLCVSSRGHLKLRFPKVKEHRFWYVGNRSVQMPAKQCNTIPTKLITLYKAPKSNRFKLHGFWIRQLNRDIPPGYTISNATAYFLGKNELAFEPTNLFHFIKQVFFPLYYMMKSTKLLEAKAQNVVFYNSPLGRCPGKFSRFNMDWTRPFYSMLNIPDPYTSIFEDIPNPDKTCYKTTVFSKSVHLNHAHEAIEFIKANLHVSPVVCQPKLVTFINRKKYRRILNIQDLAKVAETEGYNIRIAYLEKMTLQEQAQLIHCSEILVGVTGAGLQWAYFMKNHSGVVEIAWPQFEWPFFYSVVSRTGPPSTHSDLNGIRPLRFSTLQAEKCNVNPKAVNQYYEEVFQTRSNFTEEESRLIVEDKRNYNFKKDVLISAGKLCDVTVNSEEFKKALLRLKDCRLFH